MTASLHLATRPAPTVGGAFRDLARELRGAGIEAPELDARLLVCAACGLSHEQFAARPEQAVGKDESETLARLAERRKRREPVSRILGSREFWSRDFLLGAETLDPRPDTETLVAAALDLLGGEGRLDAPLRLLDLGTGSGCILLSLLAELPRAWGVGVDISASSLKVACANARRLGLAGRAQFLRGSWLATVGGAFDLILANPPYIPSGEMADLAPEVAIYDPAPALDGGADGLDAYRAIAPGLARALRPGGHALLEIGAGQLDAVTRLLADAGLAHPRPRRDLAGMPRCLATRRREAGMP